MEIPVLGPVELAVFKAMFDRTRDWADIEAMLSAQTLDVDETRAKLLELAGEFGRAPRPIRRGDPARRRRRAARLTRIVKNPRGA